MSGPTYSATYIERSMRADTFLPFGFGDADDRRSRVAKVSKTLNPALLAILQRQNDGLGPSAARNSSLQRLAEPGAVAVLTGQQVGLLLGPLYTIYKAATAIAVAQLLEAETQVPCVPVFWLQTEDHDFPEIAKATVWLPNAPSLTLSLRDEAEARCSVNQRQVDTGLSQQLQHLHDALEPMPFGSQVMSLVRRCYAPGTPLAQAFASMLAALFERFGLLVFNPRDAAVSALTQQVLLQALEQHQVIETVLLERENKLVAQGLPLQVKVRRGSPLVFAHWPHASSTRYRLQQHGAEFLWGQGEWIVSKQELLRLVATEPSRFSTSALLRPVVQDTLFPTAAYVGGAAEVGYFAQLMPLYALFQVEPPLVVPRARFRLVPPTIRRALRQLNLTPEAWEKQAPDGAPLKQDGRLDATLEPTEHWLRDLLDKLAAFESGATGLDPGLVRASQRTAHSTQRALGRLIRRYRKTLRQRDVEYLSRWRLVEDALLPQHTLQERHFCWVSFAAQRGIEGFIADVVDAVRPLEPVVKDLQW
jgi:bacillithiol synthase